MSSDIRSYPIFCSQSRFGYYNSFDHSVAAKRAYFIRTDDRSCNNIPHIAKVLTFAKTLANCCQNVGSESLQKHFARMLPQNEITGILPKVAGAKASEIE